MEQKPLIFFTLGWGSLSQVLCGACTVLLIDGRVSLEW